MKANILDDALLLYERAQKHVQEFQRVAHHEPSTQIWRTVRSRDARTGEWVYAPLLNRETLRLIKPIVADAANNLIHALDQVAAAGCRVQSSARNRRVHFPLTLDDTVFAQKIQDLAKHLPADWLALFATQRRKHRFHMRHVQVTKELSNSSKHWALVANNAQAMAVGWNVPGSGQEIVDIPREFFTNDDRFEFLRTAVRPQNEGFQVILSMRLQGIDDDLALDPSSLFEITSRFVVGVIEHAKQLSVATP
jgi:hypothetical protein